MIPQETQVAVDWALTQEWRAVSTDDAVPVTPSNPTAVVETVCRYFAEHGIAYGTFSFADLASFLPSE